MWVMSTLILLSPLLQGYCLYTLTTLSCFVCLLFVCTSTTMSYDLFVKLIGLDLLLIIALAKTQTSGCSSCRWRRRRRQRCRPSPQQRSPQVSPAGACPKFGASFLIFCFGKKGDKIRPNLRQTLLTVFEWMALPTNQTFLPCWPRRSLAEKWNEEPVRGTWPNATNLEKVFTLRCWFVTIRKGDPQWS